MVRDTAGDIAAILHPLPEASPGEEAADAATYDAWRQEMVEKQQCLAERLRGIDKASGHDPLLTALQDEFFAKQDADANIRLLIAYGREFVRPRGYTLESLAKASGYTISGVRTAYDNEEIDQVAESLGIPKPQDRGGEPPRTEGHRP